MKRLQIMRALSAFGVGLLFGLGLIVSGMADPAKVLGFLDLSGAWDPSLALVMAGAIAVALPAFTALRGRHRALLGDPIHLPGTRHVTPRLVFGSLVFGVGWGLARLCPGPALVLAGAGLAPALLFVAAMVVGMLLYPRLDRLFQ